MPEVMVTLPGVGEAKTVSPEDLRQLLVREVETFNDWHKQQAGGALMSMEKGSLLVYLHYKLTGKAPGK